MTTCEYTRGPSSGYGHFRGCIYVSSTTIVFGPYADDYVGLYNPTANTYSDGPSLQEGGAMCYGGIYVSTTTIMLIPYYSTYIPLYNPQTNTTSNGPEHSEGDAAFAGGVYVSDTKVILVPHSSDYIGIYNPTANTYTRGPSHGEGDFAFWDGVYISDTKVVLVPLNSDYVGIYNPTANTYTRGPSHGEGDAAFIGGVYVSDTKVVLVPYNSDYIGIYNPTTNTYTRGAEIPDGFSSGILLSDNNTIIMTPFVHDKFGIYTVSTDEYTDGPARDATGSAFGMCKLSNGIVVCAPYVSDYVGLLNINYTLSFSDSCEITDASELEYRTNQFLITSASGVATLYMPNYDGEDSSINKDVQIFDFWDNTFDTTDKGLQEEPLTLSGTEILDTQTETIFALIETMMDNNEEVTISGLGDCYDAVYVITAFDYQTVQGTNAAFEWTLTLQYVRDT